MKTALTMIGEYTEEGAHLCCGVLDVCASLAAPHMTGDLLRRFLMELPDIPASAWNVNTSTLTAVGNGSGYEDPFVMHVSRLCRTGDVLAAFAASGDSPRVVKAIEVDRKKGHGRCGCYWQGWRLHGIHVRLSS